MTQTQIETLQTIPLAYYEKGYAEMASYGEEVVAGSDTSRWNWNLGILACTYIRDARSVTRGLDFLDTVDDAPDELRMLRTVQKDQGGAWVSQYLLGPAGLHAAVHLELDSDEVQHPNLDAHIDELVRLRLDLGDVQPSPQDNQAAMNLLVVPFS